jgi:hypothetical protein
MGQIEALEVCANQVARERFRSLLCFDLLLCQILPDCSTNQIRRLQALTLRESLELLRIVGRYAY